MTTAVRAKSPTPKTSGNWRQFAAFLKHGRLSWGWIIATIIANMAYYGLITRLPGSTAALFAGKFTTSAIMGVVINYSSSLGLLVVVSLFSLIAEARSVRSVRTAIWKRMMGIQSSYYDSHPANQLLSAVTCDAQTTVMSFLNMVVTVPGICYYLANALPQINSFSPKLLVAVLVLIPVYIVYSFLMGRWQFKVGMTIQTRIGGITGFLTERIRNLTMIKSFATEQKEEEKGVAVAGDLYKANIDYAYVNSVLVAYTLLAEVAGIIIAVLWGCALLRSGEIDMTSWLAFFLFVPTINTAFRQLTNVWASLKDVQGRAARLGAMMEAPQEAMNEQAAKTAPAADISLDHVSFSYRADTELLKNVSLTIPAGKTTAIVGPSGSGKTTILRLLEKLYLPQQGTILVGGEPLSEKNLAIWRDHISYVNQDAELFSGTIREALTYGIHRPVDDAELDRVTKLAGIDEFIKQSSQGLDSELAIWGNAMSGGQRQRMVIARELLKNADILLLDEPTSALDAETASAISDLFFKGFAGKTIVAVTHELNMIAHADQIVVMNQGNVEGVGTHEELMASCDTYRELVEEQSYQEVFLK